MQFSQKGSLFLFAAIALLGFALRTHNINRVSLRGDEAFTLIHWVREPLDLTLFGEVALRDPQPPLAYISYHVWGLLVGDSPDTVRFLPALINLIGTAAMFALGKHLRDRRVGLLAAFLWAVHPLEVWHAQDARNYALWGAMTAVSLWLALRALRHNRLVDWVPYVALAAVSAYLYYLELFVVAALNLFVILAYSRKRSLLIRWLASQVALALVLAPWFLQERLLFGSGYGGTAGSFDPVQLLTWFLPTLAFGETSFLNHVPAYAALLCVLIVAGMALIWTRDRRAALLILLLILVPLLGIAVVSTRLDVFVPRYVMSVVIPLLLLMAYVVRSLRRVPVAVVASVVFLVMGTSLYVYAYDYAKSPDWNTATQYLSTISGWDAAIVNTSADEAYTLYHTEQAVMGDLYRLPANPSQPAEEIERVLNGIAAEERPVWLVAETPSDWENSGVVEAWLAQHYQLAYETRLGGVRLEQFLPARVSTSALPQQPLSDFDEIVTLIDAHITPPPTASGIASIQLTWRPESESQTDLKSFVHVIGEPNPATGTLLWSQDDQFPRDGALSTTSWEQDSPFREIYLIPLAGLPDGEYAMMVGWYDETSGARLETDSGSTEYSLGRLWIHEGTVEYELASP